eukprot:m.26331 g.26331  ORF g.26331 m.26331 type:complete len:87 (+) comp8813_c1_seq1:109-369(+)
MSEHASKRAHITLPTTYAPANTNSPLETLARTAARADTDPRYYSPESGRFSFPDTQRRHNGWSMSPGSRVVEPHEFRSAMGNPFHG